MARKAISLVFATVLAAAIAGCKLRSSYDFYDGSQTDRAQTVVGGFADESYVWESFHFTTNRVPESK